MKTSPIYLDRLAKALGGYGVNLKRSQLIELAAAAFGYHNSNEFSAAAKRGDLNPPAVTPIGKVELPSGHSVLIVTDNLANAPYGIDETFVSQCVEDERAEKIGITPYGHLAWLYNLADQAIPQLTISDANNRSDMGELIDFAKEVEQITCIDTDDLPFALEALSNIRSLAQKIASTSRPTTSSHPLDTASTVAIGRETLEWLIDASSRYTEDLSSGLDDGTYDEDANIDDIERAIELAQARLKAPTPTPSGMFDTSAGQRMRLFTATIDHKHGTNAYAALSEDDLYQQIADYCDEWWDEVRSCGDLPETTKGLSNHEIVSLYFENHHSEGLTTGEADVPVNAALVEKLGMAAPVAPLQIGNIDLPAPHWLKDVASVLEDGAAADIWFDAHNHPGEEAAADSIDETKRAMTEAANLLHKIATHEPDSARVTHHQVTPQSEQDPSDKVLWLTDHEGNPTFDSETSQQLFDRLGLSYHVQDGEFHPLTEDEYTVVRDRRTVMSRHANGWTFSVGHSALYRGRKFHVAEIGIMWGPDTENTSRDQATVEIDKLRQDLEPKVKALGGHIVDEIDATDCTHELSILLPFSLATEAGSLDDYFRAIDYLINGMDDPAQKQVTAEFEPQAWVNDYAVVIDAEDDKKFNVTFELLLMGWEAAEKLEHDDDACDDLRYAHLAPRWVRDHNGPFRVIISSFDVEDLFNIVR